MNNPAYWIALIAVFKLFDTPLFHLCDILLKITICVNRNIHICAILCLMAFSYLTTPTIMMGCAKNQHDKLSNNDKDVQIDLSKHEIEVKTEYDNPIWDLAIEIAHKIPDQLERSIVLETIANDLASEALFEPAFDLALNIPDIYYRAHSISTLSRSVIMNEIIPQYLYHRLGNEYDIDPDADESNALDSLLGRIDEITRDIKEPITSEPADSIRDILSSIKDEADDIPNPFKRASVLMAIADSYRILGNIDEYNDISTEAISHFDDASGYLDAHMEISRQSDAVYQRIDDNISDFLILSDQGDYEEALIEISKFDDTVSVVVALSYIALFFESQDFVTDEETTEILNRIATKYGASYTQ